MITYNVQQYEGSDILVLARVVYEGQEEIIDELRLALMDISRGKPFLKVLEKKYQKTNFIDIVCDPLRCTKKLKNSIFHAIALIVYRFIINIFAEKEMNYFFDNSYFFIKYDEINEVKEKVLNILMSDNFRDDSNMLFIEKKADILNKIENCIEEKSEINITGFIRFRMRELFQDIEEIVDKVVERHMIEREYNEFIKLLKYFVEIQENKIDEVNIIINRGGTYIILDENQNNIYEMFLDDFSDFNMSMVNTNKDDLLISGLITNSPKNIIIHGVENSLNVEIIETIKQVFEERVSFCHGCSKCFKTLNKLIK